MMTGSKGDQRKIKERSKGWSDSGFKMAPSRLSHVPLICAQISSASTPLMSAAPLEEARSAASTSPPLTAATLFPRLVSILYGY